MRPPALTEEEASELAYNHDYQPFEYGGEAKRMPPEKRFNSLFNAYIDLCTGAVECDKPPSYFTVAHDDLLTFYKKQGFHFSRPGVFSYFKSRQILSNCILIWAEENFNAKTRIHKAAARKIALQYFSAHGHTGRFPSEPNVTWRKTVIAK
jgi:hypothetical protein